MTKKPKHHNTLWTEGEMDYLSTYCQTTSIANMGKSLGRTPRSVKNKLRDLGLNSYVGERVSAKMLARCFKSDTRVSLRWLRVCGLPHRRITRGTATQYLVEPKEFWKWAEQNKEQIPWHKYEKYSLLPEPKWLTDTINSYPTPKHRKRVTDMEKLEIVSLYRRGLTCREIAERTGRSLNSIRHIHARCVKDM